MAAVLSVTTVPSPKVLLRRLSVGRVTAKVEAAQPIRYSFVAMRIALQIFLVACLWRALYAQTPSSGGLDKAQAVSYAVLAILITRQPSIIDRYSARDALLTHIQQGTVLYWFLRPMPPRRYYFVRALGDLLYTLAWVVPGYVLCLVTGLVQLPASWAAAGVFVLAFVLGLATMYFLNLLMDLTCFWAVRNVFLMLIFQLVQNLLSGVYAPLWFFPAWFATLASVLPFQGIVSVPLSLYVGRIAPSHAWGALGVQVVWLVALALLTRFIWSRAALRVTVQGG